MEDNKIRLQKYMADCGVASRRKCEELIEKGLVKVNGEVITKLGTKIDVEKDTVEYNRKVLGKKQDYVYILLNKPIGYVTTVKDQFNRDNVLDLVKIDERIVPVRKIRYVYIRCIIIV